MPVGELKRGYSPRLNGENVTHVQILAETGEGLPPILVHRPTMRVIDGMHRLRAAKARGDTRIGVEFFDGTEEEAFIRAVRDNIQHGLPLSRADRAAAAQRILRTHPAWSNRSVAAMTGLSAPTVGAIRNRMTDKSDQSNTRVGRDGRIRPLSSAEGRLRASGIIRERPDASLRDVAREAGVSVSTAQDVRKRLERGADPVPDGLSRRPPGRARALADTVSLLAMLRRDPSLRFSQTGRSLLQWFGVCAIQDGTEPIVDAIPEHCAEAVATLAHNCAQLWTRLEEELDRRRTAGA